MSATNDPCLWVRDSARKGHLHPDELRCTKAGVVFCAPCLAVLHPSPATG